MLRNTIYLRRVVTNTAARIGTPQVRAGTMLQLNRRKVVSRSKGANRLSACICFVFLYIMLKLPLEGMDK